jgi:hypothetical protein
MDLGLSTGLEIAGKLLTPLKWVLGRFTGKGRVVILPKVQGALGRHDLYWGDATVGQQKAMQILGYFALANSTPATVQIVEARLRVWVWKWGIPRRKAFLTDAGLISQIPPGQTRPGQVMWITAPAFRKHGQSFTGHACFVDSLGRKHWTPKLLFHDPWSEF